MSLTTLSSGNVNVKLLEFLDLKIHNFNILKKIIIQNIRKVKGDFRQEKINSYKIF